MMNNWWLTLTAPEKVLWVIAVFTTAIFLVQLLLSAVGGDSDAEAPADGDFFAEDTSSEVEEDGGASLGDYFTVKNAIAFFLGMSWGTIAMLGEGATIQPALLVGGGIGFVMVVVNLLILRALASLKDSGNVNLHEAVGHEGIVSVLVPQHKAGFGKVTVSFAGRQMELMALTEDSRDLPRGTPVRVSEATDSRIMVQAIN